MMQGYRFCRPMDAPSLQTWIAARQAEHATAAAARAGPLVAA
jgi:hypothetical protein